MKQFRYEAKKGRDLVKGILLAETKDGAIDKINEMGLVPVELVEEAPGGKQRRVLGGLRADSFRGGEAMRSRSFTDSWGGSSNPVCPCFPPWCWCRNSPMTGSSNRSWRLSKAKSVREGLWPKPWRNIPSPSMRSRSP